MSYVHPSPSRRAVLQRLLRLMQLSGGIYRHATVMSSANRRLPSPGRQRQLRSRPTIRSSTRLAVWSDNEINGYNGASSRNKPVVTSSRRWTMDGRSSCVSSIIHLGCPSAGVDEAHCSAQGMSESLFAMNWQKRQSIITIYQWC